MHIHCLGLNHRTANVALRERLAFTPQRLEAALARMGCGGAPPFEAIGGMVILSTCNRTELYTLQPNNKASLAFFREKLAVLHNDLSRDELRML